MLFHAGYDTADKHNRSTPQQLARVRRDFPYLRMIIAHWGGVDQQEAVWELRTYGFELRLAFEDDRRNREMFHSEGVPCIYIHSGYYE